MSPKRKMPGLVALAVALALAGAALGREQITIQKSATDAQTRAADAFLDQANPTATNGGGATLQVQSRSGSQNQRALVQFDVSGLPNGGIKSATLTLHVVTPPSNNRTYNAHRVTSFFTEAGASWNQRVSGVTWGAAGGDFNGTATASTTVTTSGTSASWNITADVQQWYNGVANYGTLIKDNTENSGTIRTTVFSSKEAATSANRPQLQVTFMQNVTNLKAAPGNGKVTLTWAYPAAIGTVLEAYTGVLILRRSGLPVDKSSFPADGTDPALCSTQGSGVVIFKSSSLATSFTDDGSSGCGAPTNDTDWYYKVFLKDSANNYAYNPLGTGDGSTFTSEISARPSATSPYNSAWVAATHATNLAAPGLIPGSVVMIGAQSNLLFTINATTGLRSYPPVSIGGAVSARVPIVESPDSSLGRNISFVPAQDNLVYAVDSDTGQIVWAVNPTGLTTNAFQGGASVQVKSFSTAAYTRSSDLVVAGTRNAGTTTANRIVGLDANTGATGWQVIGGGSNPAMDIVNSTPLVDYVHNAIWVTSRSAGGTGQPSLWKINPNNGAVLATANLNDVDSSPELTPFGEVLFVGNNAGTLFAINPTTGATLASFNGGDGAIRGFPVVVTLTSPFTVIFSTSGHVQAVRFDTLANSFTSLWSTPVTSPSAPIGFSGLTKVYVGSSDGRIHELDLLANGADSKQRDCNTGQPGVVGDPSLDVVMSRIYVSTTDQRMYAFVFPF